MESGEHPEQQPRLAGTDGATDGFAWPPSLPGNVPTAAVTEVVAVRHGESTANVFFARQAAAPPHDATPPPNELPPTDAEVPLSPTGARESALLGRRLAATLRPSLVLCSPYLRARQTWRIVADELAVAGVQVPPLLVDERLRDRELGAFALLPPDQLRTRDPEEAARRDRLGDWFYRPPGGESLADVALRVRGLLAELPARPEVRSLLVVAHDGVLQTLRQCLAGVGAPPPDLDIAVPTGSLSRWTRRAGRLVQVEWGTIAHLEGG